MCAHQYIANASHARVDFHWAQSCAKSPSDASLDTGKF